MIEFLDLNKFKKGLKPVTSAEMFSKPGEFHPEGLFSEVIFGPEESVERKKTFSYVNLNANVIHPTAYGVLVKLDMKIQEFLSSRIRQQPRLFVRSGGWRNELLRAARPGHEACHLPVHRIDRPHAAGHRAEYLSGAGTPAVNHSGL